jgi:biotin carboxylase
VTAGHRSLGGAGAGVPRRLAFAYHPRSFGALAVAEAARQTCELIWIVDSSVPEVTSMSRLLRRLGPLVDVAGLSLDEAASRVRALAPDGILALADTLLLWTAHLAQRLGLPFIAPEVAERLTDKHAQRTALRGGGLPVPGFWRIPASADAAGWAALTREATFPALLKPRHGEGSRDVTAVESLEELRPLVAQASQGGASEPPPLVLEEYLRDRPGGGAFASYVSVESLVAAGRISHLAVTGRFPLAAPFRETGFFIPGALDDADQRAVLEVASAAVEALGVSIGCLHTEIKLTPEGPRVIELNGRIGGGVPEMLSHATGVEILPLAMRLALGDEIAFDELPECTGVAYLFYVQAPAAMRRVVAVDGLDELRGDPSVHEVILVRGPGQSVDWREGNHGHVFSVRGSVADHEALTIIERRIHAETEIRGE